MIKILVALVCVVVLSGCTNLIDKAFVSDSEIYGFKATLGADPASGSVTPSLAVGSGSNILIDLPIGDDASLEYEKNTNSFFGEMFGVTQQNSVKVKITSGASSAKVETKVPADSTVTTTVNEDSIQVNVKDDSVVTLP